MIILSAKTMMIHTCAKNIAHSIHSISKDAKPKEFEVQFYVKFDLQVGAVLAKTSKGTLHRGEANLYLHLPDKRR
jgi:hypothetical protein